MSSRKRGNSSSDISDTKRRKLSSESLDKQFEVNLTQSLKKAATRQSNNCNYDTEKKACYRKNADHFKECAHKFHYCDGDIHTFKPDTDKFLSVSSKIYKEGNRNFSVRWLSEVGARTGDEQTQFAQSDFNRFDSFYFYFLANLLIHLEEYAEKYTPEFLIVLLTTFESADATGLFTLSRDSQMDKKLKECGVKEHWLLGNTTIKDCLQKKYLEGKSSIKGGKYIKKRKTLRKHKRSSSKRSSSSNNKRSSKRIRSKK